MPDFVAFCVVFLDRSPVFHANVVLAYTMHAVDGARRIADVLTDGPG
jgi:hypothetical protein